MNLNHMNKPTVFDCENCGQRIFKNNKQYHEVYQCERKNGQRQKYKQKQTSDHQDLITNPQIDPLKSQQKHEMGYQRNIQSTPQKKSEPKKQKVAVKKKEYGQPQLVKKNSQGLKGKQRNEKFCDEYDKRWGVKQQFNVAETKKKGHQQSHKNNSKTQIQHHHEVQEKIQEKKIQEIRFECQECLQMISVYESEYHFSVCDPLKQCQYCRMFVNSSVLEDHENVCLVKEYQQGQNGRNPILKQKLKPKIYQTHNHYPQYQQKQQYRQYLDFEDLTDHSELFQFDPHPKQNYGSYHNKQLIVFTTYKKQKKANQSKNQLEQDIQQRSCSICLLNYQDGQKIAKLPCLHDYHPDCIIPWVKQKNKCPICRIDFDTIQY